MGRIRVKAVVRGRRSRPEKEVVWEPSAALQERVDRSPREIDTAEAAEIERDLSTDSALKVIDLVDAFDADRTETRH